MLSRLRALGLVAVGAGGRDGAASFHGTLVGQDVHVTVAAPAGGRSRVILESALAPALDLGLVVRRVKARLAGGIAVDGLVDGEHLVAGDEIERVQALLGGDVMATIRAIAELGGDVDLDDLRARVVETRDVEEVPEMLSALATATAAVARRARALPPAAPLAAAAEGWRHVAAAAGLIWRGTPLTMVGERASASTRRMGPLDFVSSAWVGHPGVAELGVAVRRARVGEPRTAWGGGAAHVEDPAFDRMFTVVARDPAAAARVLDAPTRRALRELALVGEIRLDETGLSLTEARPEEIPRAIDRMRAALDGAVASLRTGAGAYR